MLSGICLSQLITYSVSIIPWLFGCVSVGSPGTGFLHSLLLTSLSSVIKFLLSSTEIIAQWYKEDLERREEGSKACWDEMGGGMAMIMNDWDFPKDQLKQWLASAVRRNLKRRFPDSLYCYSDRPGRGALHCGVKGMKIPSPWTDQDSLVVDVPTNQKKTLQENRDGFADTRVIFPCNK